MVFLKKTLVYVTTIAFVLAMLPMDSFAVKLEEGTPVVVELTEEVNTKTKNLNDQVFLKVSRDVVIDGKTVIVAGTPATGTITWLEKPEMVGGEGKVQFTIDSTKAVDGTRVTLRGTATRMGKDKQAASIGLGVICCPLFLLMKGKEASFPIGTEFKIYVDYSVDVSA